MPICKLLFLNNLRSKWLGTDSESRPPPPDVPIKIQDNSRRHSSYSAIRLSTSGSKRWISTVMADDQNSDFVTNAAEQEVIREPPQNSLSGYYAPEITLPDSEHFGLSESDPKSLPRGDPRTAAIADFIHRSTTTPQRWNGGALQMQSAANVSQQLSRANTAAKANIKPARPAI
jgi:hypothetical protein